MQAAQEFDVVIIGAGVVGCAVAYELARYEARVAILEASDDVCGGASRANSGIVISGFDCTPGSLETGLVLKSRPKWESLVSDLGLPYRRLGELVVAFTDEEAESLVRLRAQSTSLSVATEIISGEAARSFVPDLSARVEAALHVPSEAIVDPIKLTISYATGAVINGAALVRSAPATAFRSEASGAIAEVLTPAGAFATRFVVNAAGVHADEVSRAAGAEDFRMWPRKGQFILVDRVFGQRIGKIIAPPPRPDTRGTLLIPTTNGHLLVGPTALDDEDKADLSTDLATLDKVVAGASEMVPGIVSAPRIKVFAGARPASDRLYRVERSALVPNLIHAAGIRSTGVSASPAIAEYVVEILKDAGLNCPVSSRPARLPEASTQVRDIDPGLYSKLAKEESGYRTIVCACEHVSAAEIADALTSPVPAKSLEGLRRRTNASGGRCQGSYCMVGLGFMLSNECGCEAWAVPKSEPGSEWGVQSE